MDYEKLREIRKILAQAHDGGYIDYTSELGLRILEIVKIFDK